MRGEDGFNLGWRVRLSMIASLSNDDGDGNENGNKAMGLDFLYISLPSLHDYNVKVPKFTFSRGREHKTTTFYLFS